MINKDINLLIAAVCILIITQQHHALQEEEKNNGNCQDVILHQIDPFWLIVVDSSFDPPGRPRDHLIGCSSARPCYISSIRSNLFMIHWVCSGLCSLVLFIDRSTHHVQQLFPTPALLSQSQLKRQYFMLHLT